MPELGAPGYILQWFVRTPAFQESTAAIEFRFCQRPLVVEIQPQAVETEYVTEKQFCIPSRAGDSTLRQIRLRESQYFDESFQSRIGLIFKILCYLFKALYRVHVFSFYLFPVIYNFKFSWAIRL